MQEHRLHSEPRRHILWDELHAAEQTSSKVLMLGLQASLGTLSFPKLENVLGLPPAELPPQGHLSPNILLHAFFSQTSY